MRPHVYTILWAADHVACFLHDNVTRCDGCRDWISPLPRETIQPYATRLAAIIEYERPCVVGGASFGGAVALELALQLRAEACILIGSLRSPTGLPLHVRMLFPLVWFGPDLLQRFAAMCARFGSWMLSRMAVRYLQRLASPEAAFERWAICALICWRPSPAARRVRVFQIHGADDRVLPISLARPDISVPNGVHALSSSHPEEVNAFIEDVLRQVE